MRVVNSSTGEKRDALAQDWGKFMQAVGVEWIPLPNIGTNIVNLTDHLGLTGLLLSGGNSIGQMLERDETETALLQWALKRNLPVMAVCRGLQMLQHFFGGKIVPIDKARHVRQRHMIKLQNGTEREVNSYHTLGVLSNMLSNKLVPLAICPLDNTIEAVCGRDTPVCGMLWHPEREPVPFAEDVALFRRQWHIE